MYASQVEAALNSFYEASATPLDQVLLESPHSGYSTVPSSTLTGHFVLSLGAITSIGYIHGHYKWADPSREMLAARLAKGDLLVTRSNTRELVGFAGIFDEDRSDVSFPDTMMRLPVDTATMHPAFLEAVLLSERGRVHMKRTAAGTSDSMKKINRQTLSRFSVPTPSLGDQKKFCETVLSLRDTIRKASDAVKSTGELKKQLINQVWA